MPAVNTTDRMSSAVLNRFRSEAATYAATGFDNRDAYAGHGIDASDSMAAWNRLHPNTQLDKRIGAAFRKAYRETYAALAARLTL